MHRAVFTSIKNVNPHKKDGKYITDEFISTLIFRIVSEFIEFYKLYNKDYNEFIICLDDHSKPYWRKSIYFDYKAQRKWQREESDVNYDEVFKHVNILIDVLKNFTNFRVIGVPGVEADDIIGLLTRKYARFEKILILSPDKDFKQLHSLGQIRQYSSLTNKWVIPDDVEEWKLEHICCGDSADNVPRIVDFLQFTPEFSKFLNSKGLALSEEQYFDIPETSKSELVNEFRALNEGIRTHNKPRFGITFVKKAIAEYGSLDSWLDSNALLRKTYEMNKRLVIDDCVPAKVEADILREYTSPKNQIDLKKLKTYFDYYDLSTSCLSLFSELIQHSTNVEDWGTRRADFDNILI